MRKAINLATGAELEFDDATTPEYAVAYGHYVESLRMASWFFNTHMGSFDTNDAPEWLTRGGFIRGKCCVALGDWVSKLD